MTESVLGSPYAASIVDTVREPLMLLTDDARVLMANRSFCEAFGVDQGQLTGRSLFEVNDHSWDTPGLRRLLDDLLPANTELRDFEVERVAPGGRQTLLLNARRLKHPDPNVRLILLAFADVTERRRLEHALRVTMAELERSNQELESFASVASHDLQEPLRKIRAFGERLEAVCDGQLPEKGRDYLSRMKGAAPRMQRLITDLLSLARVTIRREPWAPVDVGAIVASVAGDLEVAIARTGARVEVGPLPSLEADATQMRQLFQNLIANALKFHGAEPPLIGIASAPADASGDLWRIDVTDNGIGFEPRHAERIFTAFERLHPREAFEGTGIGLAVCRRIVQRHGGTITADSQPGQGARFTIHLPARHEDPS